MKIFYTTILFLGFMFANDANLTQDDLSDSTSETTKVTQKTQLVNINTASKEQLMTLEGITAERADAIIEYRKTHKFKSIDGIKNVPFYHYSIASEFDKIKNDIVVNQPTTIDIAKASNKTIDRLKSSIKQAKTDVSVDLQNQINKVINSKKQADKNRVVPLKHGLNQAGKELQSHITKEPVDPNDSLIQPEILPNQKPKSIKESFIQAIEDIKLEFNKKDYKSSKSAQATNQKVPAKVELNYDDLEETQSLKDGFKKAVENIKDMNFTQENKEKNEDHIKEYFQDEKKEIKNMI